MIKQVPGLVFVILLTLTSMSPLATQIAYEKNARTLGILSRET